MIAGAGLAGVELTGELTEFLTNLAKSYLGVSREEIHLELLEGGPKVLPEMDLFGDEHPMNQRDESKKR